MNRDTNEKCLEQTGKGFQQSEAGTSVGVPQDNRTTDGSSKVKGALVYTSQYRILAHIFWAIFAWLLVMYAVDQIKLPSTAKSSSSESPISEKDDTTTSLKSLSQDTDSSSSLANTHPPLSSFQSSVKEKDDTATFSKSVSRETDSSSPHTTYQATNIIAACTLSPQNMSLIRAVSSACECLLSKLTVDDGPVTVTVVRKVPRDTPNVQILLISICRQRRRRSRQLFLLTCCLRSRSHCRERMTAKSAGVRSRAVTFHCCKEH